MPITKGFRQLVDIRDVRELERDGTVPPVRCWPRISKRKPSGMQRRREVAG